MLQQSFLEKFLCTDTDTYDGPEWVMQFERGSYYLGVFAVAIALMSWLTGNATAVPVLGVIANASYLVNAGVLYHLGSHGEAKRLLVLFVALFGPIFLLQF